MNRFIKSSKYNVMSLCYDFKSWNPGNSNPNASSDMHLNLIFGSAKELSGGMKIKMPDLYNKLSLQLDLYCTVYFSYISIQPRE